MSQNTIEINGRSFTLSGQRCIVCNQKCKPSVEGGSAVSAFNKSWEEALGVNLSRGFVFYCLAGEDRHAYAEDKTNFPKIKQADGKTPRVCLHHLSPGCVVTELPTGETFTATTSPVKG